MKVLYVASEALPYIASGGLADVANSDTIERASSKFSASSIIADAVRK